MKSFSWVYSYFRNFELREGTKFGEFIIRADMPKEIPEKIGRWLLLRIYRRTMKNILNFTKLGQ